jgi:hypothetical protein
MAGYARSVLVKTKDATVAAEDLKKKGFNVTDIS